MADRFAVCTKFQGYPNPPRRKDSYLPPRICGTKPVVKAEREAQKIVQKGMQYKGYQCFDCASTDHSQLENVCLQSPPPPTL